MILDIQADRLIERILARVNLARSDMPVTRTGGAFEPRVLGVTAGIQLEL